jgi:hypothetical protein
LLEQHKQFAKMVDKMKTFSKGGKNNMMGPQNMAKMANVVPPHIMKQMGGESLRIGKSKCNRRHWRFEQPNETNGRDEFQYSWIQMSGALNSDSCQVDG